VKKCHHPWEGMTINPQGYIIHCCETPKRYITHIDKVSSLTDTFNNHPSFKKFRESIPASCLRCFVREEKGIATAMSSPALPTEFNGKIRSLEYTMSNMCNATCSMCTSYFSSSWYKYDKKDPPSFLSDSAFNKILDIIPDIEHLTIKGGEPFLDKRNLAVLKKFLESSDGKVDIITNGSLMTDDCFDTRVHLGFSVDGTYDVYKWIRSTDWDTVINNAKRFYDATGKGVSIESCISLHNYFHVEQFYDFFVGKPYIYRINQNHFVDSPSKNSIHCLPDDLLISQRDKNLKIIEKYLNNPQVCTNNYSVMKSIRPREDRDGVYTKENAFNHIDFINSIRGFDLLDHVPELKEWRDK